MKRRWAWVLGGVVLVMATGRTLPADTVRLSNGDTLQGRVVSLDEKELKLESSLLGTLSIARKNVQSIVLGDGPAAAPAPSPANAVTEHLSAQKIDPNAFRADVVAPAGAPGASPREVVRQLQSDGMDPKLRRQLEQTFPLLATPEVQQYFTNTVSGLSSGQLTIDDVRKDAVRARDQLLDLQKDLGPSGQPALAPYLSILNRFIDETDREKPKPKALKPADRKPRTP